MGTSLMEVFIDFYPEYEVLLNSDPKVQDFYRRFSFTDYNKTQHKRPKQYKTMNPSTSSRLMIRTETSKNTAIKLPQIREHLNPLHQFLDENNEIPEIYPAYNENHLRIFYVKNGHYWCSHCTNDGCQSMVRRDKGRCSCKVKKMKLNVDYIIIKTN